MDSTERALVFASMLALAATAAPVHAGDRSEAVGVVEDIIHACQEQGMLRCEPQIRGVDIVFDYIRLFDEVEGLDRRFVQFVQERYPETEAFDFDVLQASLSLSIDITFTPEQFTGSVRSVTSVPSGYDVEMENGDILGLRQENGVWHVDMPAELTSQFDSLQRFYMAGELKRSILTYRMLEAEMANLSRDEFEAAVSEDLAPVIVAVFGKERFPAALRWLTKDVSAVIGFYKRFSSIEAMRTHIREVHGG